jgi:hypothetical protein
MSALAERLLAAVRLGNSVRISVGWAIAMTCCMTPTPRSPRPSTAARTAR